MEIWIDIKNYEGLYQVSNLGRVKSLERVDCRGQHRKEMILKPDIRKGYHRVRLFKGGKGHIFRVHRLVAEAFLDNPDNLPQVNHKDEDKSNNCVDNLEFCDARYNVNYGTGIQRNSDKQRNAPSKSKAVYQYTLDGEFVAEYPSVMEAYRQSGCAFTHISACCRGNKKQAYGYIWHYKN